MKFVIIAIVSLVVIALILFPEFRKKLKVLVSGFLNVFVEDAAKTPDGAKAVFNEAINEIQTKYSKAQDTLAKLSGELDQNEKDKDLIAKNIKEAESKCERFVASGDMKNAQLYADQRSDYLVDLKRKEAYLEKLRPMVSEAKQMCNEYDRKLKDLKRNRKSTIESLQLNSDLKEMYKGMDELRKDSSTSKLLDSVMEKSADVEKEATGAKIVHENKLSTQISNAEKKAREQKNDEYIESLKRKYQK